MLTAKRGARARHAVLGLLVAGAALAGCATGDGADEVGPTGGAPVSVPGDQGATGGHHGGHSGPHTTQQPAGPSGVEPVSSVDMAWSAMPGDISGVGIGGAGEDEGIWALGADSVEGGHPVRYWNGSDWDVLDQGAVAIDVDRAGYPWIVDSEDRIHTWDGSEWVERPGTARDIATGADGSVWIVGTDPAPGGYRIHRWTETSWEEVPGGAVGIALNSQGDPSVTRQAEPWIVDDQERVSRWTGSDWEVLPGRAQDIGVGANGAVWIVGVASAPGGYEIATWNGEGWAPAPGGGVQVGVNANGFPFVVTDDGRLLRGR